MLATKWGALHYMPEVMLSRPTPTTPSVLEQCQLFQEDGLVYRMGTEGEVRMWSLRFQLSNSLLPHVGSDWISSEASPYLPCRSCFFYSPYIKPG